MKIKFKKLFVCISSFVIVLGSVTPVVAQTNVIPTEYQVPANEVAIGPNLVHYTYTTAKISEEEELKDVQVPIPREIRSLNTKGSCCYNSLEVLARYAKIKKLYYITRDVDKGGHPYAQGASSPTPMRKFLNLMNVKYDMITNGDMNFLIKYVKEQRRGVCFDIPGHVLNIISIHDDYIKVIDNADWSLSVQTWSMSKFKRLWGGWAYTIFAEDDIVPYYYDPYINLGIDDNGKLFYRKEYFPIPKKKLTWFD